MPKARTGEELRTLLKGRSLESLIVPELLAELMGVWGGARAFATSYHTEFMSAKEGGLVRARMLDSITRLFMVHTSNLKGLGGKDLEAMSEAELKEAGRQLFEDSNGQPQTAEQAAIVAD